MSLAQEMNRISSEIRSIREETSYNDFLKNQENYLNNLVIQIKEEADRGNFYIRKELLFEHDYCKQLKRWATDNGFKTEITTTCTNHGLTSYIIIDWDNKK